MKVKFIREHDHFMAGREYTAVEVIVDLETLTPFLFVIYDCDMRCEIGHEVEPGFVSQKGAVTFVERESRK